MPGYTDENAKIFAYVDLLSVGSMDQVGQIFVKLLGGPVIPIVDLAVVAHVDPAPLRRRALDVVILGVSESDLTGLDGFLTVLAVDVRVDYEIVHQPQCEALDAFGMSAAGLDEVDDEGSAGELVGKVVGRHVVQVVVPAPVEHDGHVRHGHAQPARRLAVAAVVPVWIDTPRDEDRVLESESLAVSGQEVGPRATASMTIGVVAAEDGRGSQED